MNIIHLEKVSLTPPAGVEELLLELGGGINGFTGTTFGMGTAALRDCLQSLIDNEDPTQLSPGFVVQSVFWMVDEELRVVGMLRVRHCLNERLVQSGGNVGYYVRAAERGKGYATAGLGLAVAFLKSLGVDRVLVTTQPGNQISARVAIKNGGVLDTPGRNPDTGEPMLRYWIQSGSAQD